MKPSVYISLFLMLYVIAALVVYTFIPGTDFGFIIRNIFYLGAPFIAILAAAYAVWSYGIPNSHALSVAYIGAGLVCWFIGEVLFFSFSLREIDPFPSIADVFYVIGYVPLAIGFIRESKSGSKGVRHRDLIIFFALLVVLTLITLYTSVFKAYDPEASLLSNTILLGYGIADLVLIAALVPVLIFLNKHTGGYISYPWRMVFLGIIAVLAADIMYSIFNESYDARETDALYIDLLWIAGYLLFAHAFVSLGQTLRAVALGARGSLRPIKRFLQK